MCFTMVFTVSFLQGKTVETGETHVLTEFDGLYQIICRSKASALSSNFGFLQPFICDTIPRRVYTSSIRIRRWNLLESS